LEADSLQWRNVILIGLPNTSFQLKNRLDGQNFRIDSSSNGVVINRNPQSGEPAGRLFIALRSRQQTACSPGDDPVVGTSQGLWPGIRFDASGVAV
jgi:hypothetical protein